MDRQQRTPLGRCGCQVRRCERLLLAAAIRRHDATRFLARVELLNGLRLVLDEAPELVRAESRLVFGALDDTEVTLRALRAALSIRGRHPNPAAAARIRQVLAAIAPDLDLLEPVVPSPTITQTLVHAITPAEPRPAPAPAIESVAATDDCDHDDADDVADRPDGDGAGVWPVGQAGDGRSRVRLGWLDAGR